MNKNHLAGKGRLLCLQLAFAVALTSCGKGPQKKEPVPSDSNPQQSQQPKVDPKPQPPQPEPPKPQPPQPQPPKPQPPQPEPPKPQPPQPQPPKPQPPQPEPPKPQPPQPEPPKPQPPQPEPPKPQPPQPQPPKPQPPQPQPPKPQPPKPQPPQPPQPVPPTPVDPEISYFHRAALWARPVSNSISWTRAVVSVVHARIRDLEQARDVEEFCPGYASASAAQREICWLRLVGGIVEFESSFQANEKPFYEGNGVYSVGLLALSTGECPNAPTTESLKNPVQNLICGVNKMAALIARGHAIDSPNHVGACAYWSTLRPPHKAQLPSGRWAVLGKKDQIIARTRSFRQF